MGGGGGSKLLYSHHHLPRPGPLFPHSDEARRTQTYFEKPGVRGVPGYTKHAQLRGQRNIGGAGAWKENRTDVVESRIRPSETGAVYHGGVGTRGKRISRGYALDTRRARSDSKRVFDRGGRHRCAWRRVYGKILFPLAKLNRLYLPHGYRLFRKSFDSVDFDSLLSFRFLEI